MAVSQHWEANYKLPSNNQRLGRYRFDHLGQASTPTREAKRETRLPLETWTWSHMVDGNDVIRP